MALQLALEIGSGFSADYWKIEKLELIKDDRTKLLIALFKDSTARLAGKEAVLTREYEWSGVDNPCTVALMDIVSSNPFHLCYDKLKTLTEFTGATDV